MKTKYILYTFVAMMLLMVSCKKYLDQQPISSPTDQTSWQTDGDANSGVAAAYALTRAAANAAISYYSYGDLYSGEFSSCIDPSYQAVLSFVWNRGAPIANNYDPIIKLRVWTPYYTAIAQANRCLQFIAGMPTSAFTGATPAAQLAQKNHYLAEAYFVRAYNYYTLCTIWGDVPLTLVNDDSTVSTELARTPQATVLKQVIADINVALPNLAIKDPASTTRNYRADKGICYALLAHLYAWMGDYDSCNTACDNVIATGSYSLVPAANFTSIFSTGQTSESIFEIAQNTLAESVQVINYTFERSVLTSPYINAKTTPDFAMNEGSLAIYTDPNDVRLTKCFATFLNGTTTLHECIKYINIVNVGGLATQQAALNNIVVFRLGDIDLLKAEALCAKAAPDYTTALALVNTVRTNRNAAALAGVSNANMLQTVFDERGRELYLEGQRSFDLIRLERLNGVQQFAGMSQTEFTAGKYYWPVEPGLFLTNSKLTQTPFWAGKL
jgi:hypothetical protein